MQPQAASTLPRLGPLTSRKCETCRTSDSIIAENTLAISNVNQRAATTEGSVRKNAETVIYVIYDGSEMICGFVLWFLSRCHRLHLLFHPLVGW